MQLDKLVTIERIGRTQDATGQVRDTWQAVAEIWASVRPVSGRDYYAASGKRAEVTHEIVMRSGADLRPADRIRYGTRIFEVLSRVNVAERNRYIRAMGKENAG